MEADLDIRATYAISEFLLLGQTNDKLYLTEVNKNTIKINKYFLIFASVYVCVGALHTYTHTHTRIEIRLTFK